MPYRTPCGVLLLATIVAGCGSDGPVNPPGDGMAASISLSETSLSFGALGSFADVKATVRDAAGTVLSDAPLTWVIAGTGVAQVTSLVPGSGEGRVTAVGNGTDTLRVRSGSASATAVVEVNQISVGVQVTALTNRFQYLGQAISATASVVDSNGAPVGAATFTWASSDPAVVAVSGDGVAVAASEGAATLTATSGAMSGSLALTVVIEGPVGGAITGAVVPCGPQNTAGPFDCDGIELLAYVPIGGLGGAPDAGMSDMWGWTDPLSGKEYAIVNRTDGTAFVDVSDPINPVYLGYLPLTEGSPTLFWHDVKVYENHAFIVADAAGAYGVQIFDLTELRNAGSGPPVRFEETARYDGIGSSHNIAINEQTGYAYVVGANGGGTTCGGALHMIDISNPTNPTFAGCFADPLTGNAGSGYTHDVQCVVYAGPDPDYAGREICVGSNETHISVADVTDKSNPVAVSRVTYPSVRYAHQGWLSEDQQYFFSNDELDELGGGASTTRTLIWDLTDLDDPVLAGEYFGPTSAIDHNHYVVGDRLYMSNYQYGIRVLDITDPENPSQVGHFDTAPTEPDVPGFGGSWSNYPFFDSGIIVATSDKEGMVVLRLAP